MQVCREACTRPEECMSYLQTVFAAVAQVVDAYLTAGDLSTFIIYALYVGGNVGALAGVISNLIQASSLTARVFKGCTAVFPAVWEHGCLPLLNI